MRRYTPYPANTPATAMLKQFAPMAVMPPSPNNSAWIMRATETAISAAQGPRRIAMRVAPVAWPVVPPRIGILNSMITKLKEAPSARYGACLALRVLFSLQDAADQNGTMSATM